MSIKKIALIAVALDLGIQPSPAYKLEGQAQNVGGIWIVMNLNATQYRLINPRALCPGNAYSAGYVTRDSTRDRTDPPG